MATTEPVAAERIREILASLVLDQARLGRSRAERAATNANKLAIAYWRSRLPRLPTDELAASDSSRSLPPERKS